MNRLIGASAGIRCRNLVKEYVSGESRVRALRGVDLDIPPGELTLLVGPSGCGKTTLISILAGTLDPTAGELTVLGADLPRPAVAEAVAAKASVWVEVCYDAPCNPTGGRGDDPAVRGRPCPLHPVAGERTAAASAAADHAVRPDGGRGRHGGTGQ